jgi:hypothetical protein
MPFFLAASLFLVLAAGSRSGWRTQADYAADERPPAPPPGGGAPPPAVQGGPGPSYWFFWWIWDRQGNRHPVGPLYLTNAAAWKQEFDLRTQYLGSQPQRWVWSRDHWIFDARPDTAFLAQAPIPGLSVGALPVDPPIRGKWTSRSFPETVTLGGRVFQKAVWQWPRPGVVAQYRENVPESSRHLFVLQDGTFVIDHVDEANPDIGNPLAHFMNDVVLRPA